MIVSGEEVGRWVAKKIFGVFNESAQAIGLKKEEIVAGVIYENWNNRSIVVHIAIDGRMTPAFLAAIFHYPFIFLGAEKLIAPIAESNSESISFVQKLGFRKEAQLLDAHPDGSLLFYTMKREECRFIGERYVRRIEISSTDVGEGA